jgi:hypothetical protein
MASSGGDSEVFSGDQFLNIKSKRLLGTSDFKERLFDYLLNRTKETNKAQYESAFFHPAGIQLIGKSENKFRLGKLNSDVLGSDGLGNFLDIGKSTYDNLQFENAIGVDYHVAIKYCSFPMGIQINPISGNPEWIAYSDQIGEKNNPDSVTNNLDGTLSFVVDSVTETGVSNAGRFAFVYLIDPAKEATTELIAKECCEISFIGGQNIITTTGLLGQTTVASEVIKYEVVILGPRVSRYTDLRLSPGYVYIGKITGNGGTPADFDTTDQKVIGYSWTKILTDGLPQDFWPTTDNEYSLGNIDHRWKQIYTYDLLMSNDFLPTVDLAQNIGSPSYKWNNLYCGILNVSSGDDYGSTTLKPLLDNTYNLGSATYTWHYLYAQHQFVKSYIDVDSSAGNGCKSDFVPTTNNTYNLGNDTYKWKNLYIDGTAIIDTLILATPTTGGFASHLYPTADATYNVGAYYYRINEIYVGGFLDTDDLRLNDTAGYGLNSHFVPASPDTWTLGNINYRFKEGHFEEIFADKLTLNAGTAFGVKSNLLPDETGVHNLGSASYKWQNLYTNGTAYIDTIALSSAGGKGVASAAYPSATNTWDLGNGSYKWKNIYSAGTIYATKIEMLTSGGNGFVSSVYPATSNIYSLGTSSYYWSDIYCDTLYYKTQSTFDTEDDLSLIDDYRAEEKLTSIVKCGETKKIKNVVKSTIPWPMLSAELDPNTGDPFIHLGDATMFLLGAIKQLSGLVKSMSTRLELLESK